MKNQTILYAGAAAIALALLSKKNTVAGCRGIAGHYEDEANEFARKNGVRLTILDSDYRPYFSDDKRPRMVYKCRLNRGNKSYTFTFGASYADPSEPSMYDVLAAMTKSDPGSFEKFCWEYGYDQDSMRAYKTYKAVQKEYEAVERLFGDVMDELWEIQ